MDTTDATKTSSPSAERMRRYRRRKRSGIYRVTLELGAEEIDALAERQFLCRWGSRDRKTVVEAFHEFIVAKLIGRRW